MENYKCDECGNETVSILGAPKCHNCGHLMKKTEPLIAKSESGVNVPLHRLVSQPIQCGKDYEQFRLLREQIKKGYKPIVYGDNYVVMDMETFKGLKKLTEKVG